MRRAGRFQDTLFKWGFAALLTLAPSLASASGKIAGEIALVKGEVFILSAKDKSVVADPTGKRGRSTQKGSPFFEGETIQTKDTARVKLIFKEGGNEVVLGPNTSLIIERAGATKPGTELSLKQGAVRSSVNKKYSGDDGDVFEVKTPNSVAGVRGTVVNVAYDNKKNTTQVFTERGLVAVTNVAAGLNKNPVVVGAGMFSEVSKTETPSPPKAAPPQMLDAVVPEVSEDSAASGKSSGSSGSAPTEGGGEATSTASGSSDSKNSESKPVAENKPENKSESKAEAKAEAKTESKKSEGPAVALAPQPADSTSKPANDTRAPASTAGTAAPAAPQTIGAAAPAPVATTKMPFELINRQTESMRRAAEEQLRQQRLIEGNLSEVRFAIQ